MSDELTCSGHLRGQRSTFDQELKCLGFQFDQSGTKYTKITQAIGTTEEALDKGDVNTPGWCLVKNTDPTNFVSLRVGTGLGNAIRLDANGGFALFRWGSAASAPFAIADTGACTVEMLLFEA